VSSINCDIWRYASTMDKDRDLDHDWFEPLETRGLIPTVAICGTLPSTPGLFPRLDDFGRCMRCVQLGFWKPNA